MRGLIAIGLGIAVIAVAAITAVALTEGGGPAVFPVDSPEAALQAYLEAFEDEEHAAAYAYFSSAVQDQMSLDDFERFAAEYEEYTEGSRRVIADGWTARGDDALTMQLTVETVSGTGLGASRYSYQTDVPMVLEDGAWHIDQPLVHVDPAPVDFFPPSPK